MLRDEEVDLQFWADKLLAAAQEGRKLPALPMAEHRRIIMAFHNIGAHDLAAVAWQRIRPDWTGAIRMSAKDWRIWRNGKPH